LAARTRRESPIACRVLIAGLSPACPAWFDLAAMRDGIKPAGRDAQRSTRLAPVDLVTTNWS